MPGVDRGVDDGNADIGAARRIGIERDALERIVHDRAGLLQVVDVVRHAFERPAVDGKLRQHGRDLPAVRYAEAHDRHAEQVGEALRADVEPETRGDILHLSGVPVDGDQHLVRHEGAGDRARRHHRRSSGGSGENRCGCV